jgi:hypothetical protein
MTHTTTTEAVGLAAPSGVDGAGGAYGLPAPRVTATGIGPLVAPVLAGRDAGVSEAPCSVPEPAVVTGPAGGTGSIHSGSSAPGLPAYAAALLGTGPSGRSGLRPPGGTA